MPVSVSFLLPHAARHARRAAPTPSDGDAQARGVPVGGLAQGTSMSAAPGTPGDQELSDLLPDLAREPMHVGEQAVDVEAAVPVRGEDVLNLVVLERPVANCYAKVAERVVGQRVRTGWVK